MNRQSVANIVFVANAVIVFFRGSLFGSICIAISFNALTKKNFQRIDILTMSPTSCSSTRSFACTSLPSTLSFLFLLIFLPIFYFLNVSLFDCGLRIPCQQIDSRFELTFLFVHNKNITASWRVIDAIFYFDLSSILHFRVLIFFRLIHSFARFSFFFVD